MQAEGSLQLKHRGLTRGLTGATAEDEAGSQPNAEP